ncbi:PIN-like domain-containing protein [Vreelandella alkaliphila]|uniref:PIN-like domain-containing protein n=1 Tax=Vreelandella alkaliphila TaxID=272774 RepID=UPI003FD88291
MIWKEVIKKSIDDDVNIVFVTGDNKEDWWLIEKGKTIGPRVELIKEFEFNTGKNFYMYSAYSFLDIAQKKLGLHKDGKAVNEIKEVNSRNVRSKNKSRINKDLFPGFGYTEEKQNFFVGQLKSIATKLDDINEKIASYNRDIEMSKNILDSYSHALETEDENDLYDQYNNDMLMVEKGLIEKTNKLEIMIAEKERLEEYGRKLYKEIL